MVSRAREEEGMGLWLDGYRPPVWGEEEVLGMEHGGGTAKWVDLMLLLHRVRRG